MKYRIYRTGLTGLSRQPLEISNSRVLVFFVPIAANFRRSALWHTHFPALELGPRFGPLFTTLTWAPNVTVTC